MESFSFYFKRQKIKLPVKKISGINNFSTGLMFVPRKKAKALLFEFNRPEKFSLTSLFVFFPFIALWLDSKNNVIDFKKVKPFRVIIPSRKTYYRLIEIPLNKKYKKISEHFS